MGHNHRSRMRSLSQSQLETPKYKQEKNVSGVWEAAVGFSGGLRAELLELSREEVRADISQKLGKHVPV